VRTSQTLTEVTLAPDFASRVSSVVERVAGAADEHGACELLWAAVRHFGADAAAFASFVRDDDSFESYRFLLACDPRWCDEYLEEAWFASDPWLKHAMDYGTPARGSEVIVATEGQRRAVALAARYGFASSAIIPAPSTGGMSRLGVLCIGSTTPWYFEVEGFARLRVLARSLAMELHEWWMNRIKRELIEESGLSSEDLRLLAYEWHGLSSKEIARQLNTSPQSINSRFQRLLTKLGTPNRKAAARLAAEYGLISGM
jgi:DNA-binding CsgD family transcriptional regulator